MRVGKIFAAMMTVILLTNIFTSGMAAPPDDPTKKLGVLLGKWQVEAAFASGEKAASSLECRWSPQGAFLICEQIVKMGKDETRQLTVYSYNSKDNTYSYSTFSGPGTKPTSNNVVIQGNVWTYDSSYESNGKTTQVHNTNDFTDPKTEVFKIVTSDDGGAHWTPMLEGRAHKTAD
jgi:hypothetical protein